MIYYGYQGCGKSTYCRNHPDTTVDLDSSYFNKYDGWEINYINIANLLSESGKNVFISAHKVVINKLLNLGIQFELLIPSQNEKAWRSRLEFQHNTNPSQANMNAILDFDKNYQSDMAFYQSINCKKHHVSATIVTNIEECIS